MNALFHIAPPDEAVEPYDGDSAALGRRVMAEINARREAYQATPEYKQAERQAIRARMAAERDRKGTEPTDRSHLAPNDYAWLSVRGE